MRRRRASGDTLPSVTSGVGDGGGELRADLVAHLRILDAQTDGRTVLVGADAGEEVGGVLLADAGDERAPEPVGSRAQDGVVETRALCRWRPPSCVAPARPAAALESLRRTALANDAPFSPATTRTASTALVHRGERRHPVEEEQLVGGDAQLHADARRHVGDASATQHLGDGLVEHRHGAQDAVDDLGRQRAMSRIELRRAIELGVERRRCVGRVFLDAQQHRRGHAARGSPACAVPAPIAARACPA